MPVNQTNLNATDPNADAQAAIPGISASYLTMLLPYLEQTVIYNQINLNLAASDTANIPPTTGPGAIHSGYNSVYSTAINAFICPSSAGPPTINYFNTFWGPYGDGGGDTCTPGAASPIGGVSNLNPPPTQIWGRTDYFPIPGLHNTALQAAGMSSGYIATVGEGKDSGTITGWPITGKIRLASITDGTSNTMMISECGAKPIGYNGFRQIYLSEVDGLPVDGVIEPVSSAGGAWADNFTYSSLAGARPAERHPRRHLHGQLHEQQRDLLVPPRRVQRAVRGRLGALPQGRLLGAGYRRAGHPCRRRDHQLRPVLSYWILHPIVTTVVRPWFGRDESPPTSGVSPIRRARPSHSRARLEGFSPSEPRTHVRGHELTLTRQGAARGTVPSGLPYHQFL